jgi:uncharacterized protein YcbX
MAMQSPAGEARVTALWRWPVKGLGGQSLDEVHVKEGSLFPFDRAFALENGPSDFDAAAPRHVPKRQFVCMVHQPTTGRMTAAYDESTGMLAITADDGSTLSIDPDHPSTLEELAEQLVERGPLGPLRLRKAQDMTLGHGFTDVPGRWISLQNQASIDRLARSVASTLDPRRLRANVLLEGWNAFAEEELVGKTVRLGTAEIIVEEPINRCRAIDVNPDTAAHDQDLVRALQGMRGKPSLGIYARVTKAGRMAPGDQVVVL